MKTIIRPIINFCVVMLIIFILKLIGFYQPEHFLVYYLLGAIHVGINVIFMILTEN